MFQYDFEKKNQNESTPAILQSFINKLLFGCKVSCDDNDASVHQSVHSLSQIIEFNTKSTCSSSMVIGDVS